MSTRAPSVLSAVLVLLAAGGVRGQGDDELTDVDRKVMKELTGRKETDAVVFHYRPDDFDEATLGRTTARNAENFARCGKLLDMAFEGRAHVFLYRDLEDLRSMTGSGAVAFSTGTRSVHQARDFDSVHEFVHIYAMQFPRDQDATTDGFVTEGLATALAEVDQGVPIHSWAAVDERYGRVPGLVGFRRTWPEAPAGVHPYHVAGSFVGWLVETQGITKVKRRTANLDRRRTWPSARPRPPEAGVARPLDGFSQLGRPLHEARLSSPGSASARRARRAPQGQGAGAVRPQVAGRLEAGAYRGGLEGRGRPVGERAVGWTRPGTRQLSRQRRRLSAPGSAASGASRSFHPTARPKRSTRAIFATCRGFHLRWPPRFAGNQLVKLEPRISPGMRSCSSTRAARAASTWTGPGVREGGALFTGRAASGSPWRRGRIEVKAESSSSTPDRGLFRPHLQAWDRGGGRGLPIGMQPDRHRPGCGPGGRE
ncbi:MAG: hypothetical protein R3F30_04535 [Planctomycetota bacterium]